MRPGHRLFVSVVVPMYLLVLTLALIAPAQGQVFRQPSPGDVYREYAVAIDLDGDAWHVTNAQAVVNFPGSAGPYPNPINQLSIGAGALSGATRAEAVLTIWGGHVGTSGKQIAFNGNAFLNIPEIQTTPTSGQNYMQQINATIDVPLGNLKEGINTFQGESGPQTAYSFGWGTWGMYGVLIRIYYDPATKAHVTGTVTSPATNATIGDNPTVSASVTGSANRVDFVAYYDGYDTDGDGVFQEYHSDYHMPKYGAMAIQNHVGTATASPWSVTWSNAVVPDQSGMRMVARIRGTDGVWYVTQPTTNIALARTNANVVLYKPFNVGEREWAKGDVDDGVHPSGFQVQDIAIPSTANAVSATALIRTWHGVDTEDPNHYVKFNAYTFPTLGDSYFPKLDLLSVPTSALITATNSFTFYSEVTDHHGIEVLWPGPALAVRFSGSGGGTGPSITANPVNQTVTVGQMATFTVSASGTAPLAYQWQKNSANISGATASSYTTPVTVAGDNGATYRCVVTNGFGTATSTAATLTVSSAPPPSGIVSDDFHTGALNTSLWTVTNPRNDATVTLTGAGTVNARLSIAVPAGVAHDVWSDGNNAPRVMQAVTNTDFEAQVKFDGAMSAEYQLQGIQVQQSASTYLRFDFVRDATGIRFFAASFANNTPTIRADVRITAATPLYLRVKRVGTQWTGSYSTNGTSWTQGVVFTQALTMAAIGPFAGNAGAAPPAFTALVDYFFNMASPISPEDPTSGGNTPPTITSHPVNQTVTVGQTTAFSVAASGTATLTYQWQKNSANITGATASTYTTPATVIGDNGNTYRCVVTNGFGTATSTAATLTVSTVTPPPAGWWNAAWRYRVPVTVSAAGYARTDRPAEAALNFTQLLTALGSPGTLNASSLRVIEVNSGGTVLDSAVVFQFDKDPGYNATSNASGNVALLLSGTTAAGSTRYFHVYFETAAGFVAPVFTNRITVTDNVQDEGQASFLVATQLAQYYYHKQGAGFSSIVDLNGNDWLNYHVGGGSAGEYRGLPNLGPFAHPGYTNATSTLVTNGPIKAMVSSSSTDGLYGLTWEFYPRFARLTVTKAGGPFWLLYEGTPGGSYDPARDFWVRSSGQRSIDNALSVGDIAGPEWVYFGDNLSKRFLFLAHHEDDNLEDQYWNMENNMTVFGFGRQYSTDGRLLTQVPTHMTIGFGEDTLQAVGTIDGSFRDIGVSVGAPQSSGGGTPPPTGIVSDNFNGASLNTGLWTKVDPQGGASFTMSGSQLNIAVPGSVEHDVWSGGNMAPRVMQPAPNTDFEVEARFDASMNAGYQMQGIIVEQDASNFLRFDFVRDDTNTRFFAASFSGGAPTVRTDATVALVAPFYLRVKRTGNAWTGSYSSNGTTWTQAASFTQALTVSSVGPFAGNAGSPAPAFTGSVNYFFNTALPVTPAKIVAGNSETADMRERPTAYALSPNYPNPFNPSTVIRYALPRGSVVRLEVYAVTGELVRTLVQGEQAAGVHEVSFDARGLASGVYFYRIHAGDFVATRTMLLMR
jgi:hypothetical protein